MNTESADYQPDRRPIASRERAASKRVAYWLAQRHVSPNAISVLGMLAGIAAGGVLPLTASGTHLAAYFVIAALLMQMRLLANMLDGMVAVETDKASRVGELFNEVPDRVSDTAMFVGAGYAWSGQPWLGFTAACLAMFVAYLRAQGRVAGAHQEFCGPLAKPQRVFAMTVASLLCGLLPASINDRLAGASVAGFSGGVMAWALLLISLGTAATALRRLLRITRALQGTRQ